jgi:DNA-binding protein YbaB
MTITELIVKLGFSIDDKALNNFNKGIADTKKGMLGLIAVTGAAVGAVGALVRTAANQADTLNRNALAAGVNVEQLQRLGFAASQSGSSMEELSTSMRFLNRNVYNALRTGTGTQAEAFQKLGVSMDSLRRKTPDQLLLEISDRMNKVSSEAEKSALSMEIFGRSGTGLLEFLGKGSEEIQRLTARADAFGVQTQEQVMTLKAFNDAVGAILFIFNQLRGIIAAKLAPQLIKLMKNFEDFLVVNADIIKSGATDFFKGIVDFITIAVKVSMALANVFLVLASRLGGIDRIVTIVLTGLTLMSGALIIKGIFALTAAVFGFIKALTIAKLVAFAVPIAIAAGIALIILAIEDIYTYFQGGDSVTGLIVEKFGSAWDWVRQKTIEFRDWILSAMTALGQRLASIFTNMFSPVTNFLDSVSKRLASIPTRLFGSARDIAVNGTATGITPQSSPLRGANNTNQTNVDVRAPITITLPEGMTGSEAGERIQSGVAEGLEDALSNLGRTNARAVAF